MKSFQLLDRVARLVQRQGMVQAGQTLIAGVSGGADSLCLLHILAALREQIDFQLHVAHVDHMLRGAESAADAAFVRETAAAWHVPITVETIDVEAQAKAAHLNLHDAARRARYDMFARLAHSINAHAIAVAHTANDQAETVMMHLLRGAATNGLGGMLSVTPLAHIVDCASLPHANRLQVVRPLLTTTRTEIEAYCKEHGLAPRHDTTNADLSYTRNRIRHELLPELLTYNPRIVEVLGHTADACAEDAAFIQSALDQVWPGLAKIEGNSITFCGAVWNELHAALQRATLRRAYTQLGGTETLAWEHTEHARSLSTLGVGKRMPLPGGIGLRVGYNGDLIFGEPDEHGPQLAQQMLTIEIPGRVELADGWLLEARVDDEVFRHDQWHVRLDTNAVQLPLVVRVRQPGDRMRPAGGQGSRRIQDILTDAKIPRSLRDRWPVVADQTRILWVAGLRAAEGALAQAETEHVIEISINPPDFGFATKHTE